MTTLGLFASGEVGHRVAGIVAGCDAVELAYLVLDSSDRDGLNARIVEACGRAGKAGPVITYQPSGLALSRLLAGHVADLGLLAWWPHIVPNDVIAGFERGLLNLHPSLLPHQRGKDPNFWNLVEQTPFGVTVHYVDAGVDSGPVVLQRPIPTSWEDTGGSLYRKATHEIVSLVEEHLDQIAAGELPATPQDPKAGSFHRRSELDPASEVHLDDAYEGRRLLNLLRARTFPGQPAAWFEEEGERYEVRVDIRRVPRSP